MSKFHGLYKGLWRKRHAEKKQRMQWLVLGTYSFEKPAPYTEPSPLRQIFLGPKSAVSIIVLTVRRLSSKAPPCAWRWPLAFFGGAFWEKRKSPRVHILVERTALEEECAPPLVWLVDGLVGWLIDCLISWLIGWLVDLLVSVVGWLVDWLIGWLVRWLIG